MTARQPEGSAEVAEKDVDLSAEEEDELERCFDDSVEAQARGELIPWDALFPPERRTG